MDRLRQGRISFCKNSRARSAVFYLFNRLDCRETLSNYYHYIIIGVSPECG